MENRIPNSAQKLNMAICKLKWLTPFKLTHALKLAAVKSIDLEAAYHA